MFQNTGRLHSQGVAYSSTLGETYSTRLLESASGQCFERNLGLRLTLRPILHYLSYVIYKFGVLKVSIWPYAANVLNH